MAHPSKVLLISANRFANPYPVYPVGLSYLATYLKSVSPERYIRIFDLLISDLEALEKEIKDFQPDYIGISLRNIDDISIENKNYFIDDYKKLIKSLRESFKGAIIIGGAAYSIYPELLFSELQPDFGIYGEGEVSFNELLIALETNCSFEQIEGLVYKKNDRIQVNLKKSFLKSLDLNYDANLLDYYWKYSGMLNIQTKRGCPFKCIYCTYPIIEGRKVRTLNIDKIIDTLKFLNFEKGINYVFFIDSVFNCNKKYNLSFAKKLIKSKVKLSWNAYFTPYHLDDEQIAAYSESGMTHAEFGTESLSNTQLKNYGKHFTLDDVIESSELCDKYYVYHGHSLILGGYGETEQTLDETFANSKKIKNTVYFPYIGMRIYPGTELQKLAVKDKVITADDKLLIPKWYVSDQIDTTTIRERALETKRGWLFPDVDLSEQLLQMREKNKKGPLWHYLRI